ncbi:MAG: universal stress protein, partial [Eudoraea sp.]|nr:universal stress protein [Eudoraea sp.]
VLHVFDMSVTFISTVSIAYARLEETTFKTHTQKLHQFCKEHLATTPNESMEIAVGENSIASHGILEKAEAINADLIVIGMKGSTAVRQFFVGSTASALIDTSYVPVLTIPEVAKTVSLKKIVYATAFEQADILAVHRLVALAEPFEAEIKLIHISPQHEYSGEEQMAWFKEMLQQKVAYPNVSFELRFAEDIVPSLNSFVEEVDGDMIAMLEREGHSLLKSIWHRDAVKRMKEEGTIPVLSFHKKNL